LRGQKPFIEMVKDAGSMFSLAHDDTVANRHAPLVQLAAAIAGDQDDTGSIVLRDAADTSPAPRGSRVVTLDRGRHVGLRRSKNEHGAEVTALSYVDPCGEASVAALVASIAAPGAPIAADSESLAVLALARRLAASNIPVLINGPTGTGKEVLSRYIHRHSARRDGPFIAINCAAMPESMLEAMLFGHVKGSFTGASAASDGFFRAAHNGTLLLDEIAEMPLALQAKLLRALQEGEVVPIGATEPIKVDVRIIACANRDLPTEVAQNRFRADLFYRLNVFPLALRPLRERSDDVAPLAFSLAIRHTLSGAQVPWFTEAALDMLRNHGWPGNVRELENVVRRALLLAGDAPTISPAQIVFDQPAKLVAMSDCAVLPLTTAAPAPTDARLSNIVQISESRAIMEALAACGGSRIATARQLGISERTLRYRLASFREAGIAVGGRGL
jgi:two-component system response regulator FlrC